jgi:hypothetical protein
MYISASSPLVIIFYAILVVNFFSGHSILHFTWRIAPLWNFTLSHNLPLIIDEHRAKYHVRKSYNNRHDHVHSRFQRANRQLHPRHQKLARHAHRKT